mmetsp:Transcript_12760/g.46680  ORF Transcript_12760/g.46680 Transcript_12760/m.46680 type:complete len:240 (+) Transcript_12760:190-909(+)
MCDMTPGITVKELRMDVTLSRKRIMSSVFSWILPPDKLCRIVLITATFCSRSFPVTPPTFAPPEFLPSMSIPWFMPMPYGIPSGECMEKIDGFSAPFSRRLPFFLMAALSSTGLRLLPFSFLDIQRMRRATSRTPFSGNRAAIRIYLSRLCFSPGMRLRDSSSTFCSSLDQSMVKEDWELEAFNAERKFAARLVSDAPPALEPIRSERPTLLLGPRGAMVPPLGNMLLFGWPLLPFLAV